MNAVLRSIIPIALKEKFFDRHILLASTYGYEISTIIAKAIQKLMVTQNVWESKYSNYSVTASRETQGSSHKPKYATLRKQSSHSDDNEQTTMVED